MIHILMALALLYVCTGIWEVLRRPLRRHLRLEPERIALPALAGCLLAVMALSWYVDYSRDSWDWVFAGIRNAFAVFEGDSEDFRKALAAIPAIPELLSCLIPLLTVSATLTLLWNYLPHHVPWGSAVWNIFSELDANSIRIARELRSPDSICIFLRTRRNKADPDLLAELREVNHFLYPGDEIRFLLWPWRRKKLLRFFFLSENTDENFQRMQDLLTAAGKDDLFTPRNVPLHEGRFQQELYLLSETESAPMLIGHLRSMLCDKVTQVNEKGESVENLVRKPVFQNTELHLLDRFRATSYDLLRNVPLYAHIQKDSQGDRLHVLVLGFGKIGREFFRAACSLGILHGCTTEFTLCDLDICSKLNGFESQCPELRKSVTIHPRKRNLDTDALEQLVAAADYHYILVALGDDERNIRVASRLKRFYRLRHWEYMAGRRIEDLQPQICVNIEDPIKHAYTEGLWEEKFAGDKALHVFGGLEQVFTPEVLMPQSLWEAARYIHRQLNDLSDDDTPDWGEYERRSSIACALRAAYLDASRPSGASPEALADTEHLRWMAYVRSEGLRYADPALVGAYYEQVKGRHVDVLGKLTPCLTEDQKELEGVWTYLTNSKYADDYTNKKSFRERDLYLVNHAHEIAEIPKD